MDTKTRLAQATMIGLAALLVVAPVAAAGTVSPDQGAGAADALVDGPETSDVETPDLHHCWYIHPSVTVGPVTVEVEYSCDPEVYVGDKKIV